MPLPKGYKIDPPKSSLPEGYAVDTPDFSANDQGEGTYQMKGKGGVLHVPFSHVESASKSGFTMTDDDRARYVKDAASDPKLKELELPKGVKAVGRNSAGEPILAPDEGDKNTLKSFASSEYSALSDAAKGVGQFIDPRPTEDEKQRGLTSTYDTIMRYPERLVMPNIDMAQRAVEDERAGRTMEAIGHGGAAAIPFIGPWAAQVGEKLGQQAGAGDYTGAAGTGVGNIMVAETPKVALKTGVGAAKLAPKAVRGAAEAITKTGPRELRKLAEDTHKANQEAVAVAEGKNADAAAKHLGETQEALHKTKGEELKHEAALRDAHAKAAEETAKAAREHLEKTQKALHGTEGSEIAHHSAARAEQEAAQAKHAAEVAKVEAHNHRVNAKHQAEATRMTEENKALEHQLEMRRQAEADLKEDTDAYYAKEDATKAKAKGIENSKWEPWREKMKGVTVDSSEISAPIKKVLDVSPEARRVISQLTPEPEDAAPDSLYAQDRAAIMKVQGYSGSYFDLPPNLKAQIDAIASSNGFEPEPIDFNPESSTGIPIEQIHRAKSIIGRNIYSGRYEGPLEGEMKQIYKTLDQAETRASMKAGALDDLKEAKKATAEYQQAFGKERPTPKTVDNMRMKGANPEQFLADHDQERLDAAKKHDPSLVEDFKKVKDRRDALKKMKSEDELRKQLNQIPAPPTVGDIREGYNLKEAPQPPENPAPVPPAREEIPDRPEPVSPKPVEPPVRTAPPDRPPVVPADTRSISPEDYQKHKAENIKTAAEGLREQGRRRAVNALFYTVPTAVLSTLLGHPGYALAEMASSPVILAGSQAIASALESPRVVAWLSKVTPQDMAQFDNLSPEEKSVFTQNMGQLAKAAKSKGISISPAVSALIAGSAASQNSIQELKQEALRRNPNAIKVVAPDGSEHFFADQQSADNFKKEAGVE
jgi:hypothetical protein